jgi:hypothetical protein
MAGEGNAAKTDMLKLAAKMLLTIPSRIAAGKLIF